MRRVLLAAAIAACSTFGVGGNAQAVCGASVICAVSGCNGTVNVCLGTDSCAGTVSVCPFVPPADCHSNVDVCLGHLFVISCGPAIRPVCDLIP